MKKGIHPDYHPVLFVDHGANYEFRTRSTLVSQEKRTIDGVEHQVVRLDISSASHPFYTGKQKFVDTAGRIEKFQKKYGGKYGGKTGTVTGPSAVPASPGAPAAAAVPAAAPVAATKPPPAPKA